jgi:hypothetical protein
MWLTDVQLAAVDAVRGARAAAPVPGVGSPTEQAEREEAVAGWLADHGLDIGARDMPRSFPLDTVESAVDYDYVLIGDQKFGADTSIRFETDKD